MKTGKLIAVAVLGAIIVICGAFVAHHWESGQMTVSLPTTPAAPAEKDDGKALERHTRVAAGASAIVHGARGPVQWRSVWTAPDNTACFEFTATNALGGPVAGYAVVPAGSQRLIVGPSNEAAKAWNAACTKAKEHEYTWLAKQAS
jgi:hypothetical protein